MVESYPVYGNCFIFNSVQNANDTLAGERLLALTGPTFGLALVLNLNQKWYLKEGATPKVSFNIVLVIPKFKCPFLAYYLSLFIIIIQGGARITVHDTTLRPLVDEDGLDVTPATSTEIAIQEVTIGTRCFSISKIN